MRKRKRETGMGKIEREIIAGERERERKIVRETGVGEREREREMQGRKREGDTGERERVTGEKERVRERDRGEREKERENGERKILLLQTQKNSWNFILSCFTPQNGVKHDSGL